MYERVKQSARLHLRQMELVAATSIHTVVKRTMTWVPLLRNCMNGSDLFGVEQLMKVAGLRASDAIKDKQRQRTQHSG